MTGRVPMRGMSCEDSSGGEDDAGGDGQVGGAALDRGVAEHVLHVEGEEEEHRQEPGEGDQLGGVGGGQSFDAEDGEREQRVAGAPLDDDERDEQDGGGAEFTDGVPVAPAGVRGLDQRVDQQQHRRR